MRSLVIKAKNKYENKRAKREDGGGKGVRILGRLEVIETQKRNNCHAVNWYFLKHQRNSSLSSSTNLLSSRASASPLPHYLSTSWLAHRQLTFPISLLTAYGLVTCLPPPSLPPYPSVIRLRFSLSAACSSSYFIPVRRWLALCARAYHPLDSYSSANLLDQSPYTPPDKQTRLGYLFHINLIVIIYLLLSDPLHSFFFFFEAEGTTATELHPFRSTVIADYSP